MKNTPIPDDEGSLDTLDSNAGVVRYALKNLLENEHLMSNFSKVT